MVEMSLTSLILLLIGLFVAGILIYWFIGWMNDDCEKEFNNEYTSPNESWSSTAARACEIQTANSKGSTPNIESWIDWLEDKLIQ